MNARTNLLPCLLITLSSAAAQTPAHATALFDRYALEPARYVQSGETVNALRWSVHVHQSRSTDGGRTWPILDQIVGDAHLSEFAHAGDVLVLAGSISPTLAAGGPTVRISTDGGASWQPEQQIATWGSPPPLYNAPIGIHIDGQNVTVIWSEHGTGSTWALRSTDGGLTFPQPQVLVATGPSLGALGQPIHVVGDESTIYVYHDVGATLQVSQDHGQTWLSTPRATPLTPFDPPLIACSRETLLATTSPDEPTAQLHRSIDGGATWTTTGLPTPPNGIALVEDRAIIAGFTQEPFPALQQNWIIRTSTDAGATWTDVPFSTPDGFSAEAHIVDDDLYVLMPNSFQSQLGSLLHSDDAGQNWSVLVADVSAATISSRRTICVQHELLGTYLRRCHAFVASGWTTVGSGTPGTGGSIPRLRASGVPLAGRTIDLAVDNALTNTFGVAVVTWNAPTATPFAGGNLWFSTPVLPIAFATDTNGNGAAALTVPNTPAVAGTSLTCQALVLDAAAQAGLALTRAIELWLR